jgi:L-amino acid N-acyltransferase YncA
VEELMKFDDIEFEERDGDGFPGLLLKKDGQVTWTPVASRTRSRVSFKD